MSSGKDLDQLHAELCRALEAHPPKAKAVALMHDFADECERQGVQGAANDWRWSAATYRPLGDG